MRGGFPYPSTGSGTAKKNPRRLAGILLFENEIGFLDARTVDGLEIVFHRDDGVTVLAPFGLSLRTFCEVGMVAGIIVGHKHERHSAVLRVSGCNC